MGEAIQCTSKLNEGDVMALVNSIIWRLTRRKGCLAKKVFSLANIYCDSFRDLSSSFKKNGELNVIKILSESDCKIIFDVGANIGNWSRHAIQYFSNSEIHAFEMTPATYQTLIANIQERGSFVPNNTALGDTDGIVEFKSYGKNSPVNSLIQSNTFHDANKKIEVCTTNIMRGETYCLNKNISFIDFLKIDVEGAEMSVLSGFMGMIKSKKIRCIQFEYGYSNGDAKYLLRDFYDLLTKHGYVMGKIWSKGVEFGSFNYEMNNFKSGPNYFAVLKDETNIINRLMFRP